MLFLAQDLRRPELKRQQHNAEQTPPMAAEEDFDTPKPSVKSLDVKDVKQVKELLHEYDLSDLSGSIDNSRSNYDQSQKQMMETPKRDEREHRPSPEVLKTPDSRSSFANMLNMRFSRTYDPRLCYARIRSSPDARRS